MNLFYCSDLDGHETVLSPEESSHCIRVLRYGEGDSLQVTDGKGKLAGCIIRDASTGGVVLEIVSVQEKFGKMPYSLHVAIAPPKNHQRFEWFLEKATEIGITEITPLVCARSERKKIRTDRARKVLISAMKQSNRAYLPELHAETEFPGFLNSVDEGTRIIASSSGHDLTWLHPGLFSSPDACILVGPEGDFTEEEQESAIQMGYRPVSLGNFILRTETAGIVACSEIRRIFEVEQG